MVVDCVAVWAAAAVLADGLVLDAVSKLPAAAASAAVALTSLDSVDLAACFAMEPACGSAAQLLHAAK